MSPRRYPVGIQTFERVIKEGLVYVDKTDLIWQMTRIAPYIFLSRPRRFGKSLLTTTLDSFFRGSKDLFEGLKIMDYEKEWRKYPVIHIDLSTAKEQNGSTGLKKALKEIIEPYCQEYNVDMSKRTPGQCLKRLITAAFNQENSQVVILIDEYDTPLLEVLHEEKNLESMRKVMQEFYQPLKACERMIRFCFLTGITRFSQLSIFSTINNLTDISMLPDFSTICGITEYEMTTTMKEDIEMMADVHKCGYEEMHSLLKQKYDGYHFSKRSEEVYNPYSLMKCFALKELDNYWFDSGTSNFLFHQMKRFGTDITAMDDINAPEVAFYRPTETMTNALPLLYQAGYLTIKEYLKDSESYLLQIPNKEVRVGFTEGLLPFFSGLESADVQIGCAYKIWSALKLGDINQAMLELKAFLAGVPYVEGFKEKLKDLATREGFYEYTFYLILSMLNVYVQTQVKCWTGRTDMTVFTSDTIYIFEFKVSKSSKEALKQIKDHGYANRYDTDNRKIVLVGVNFDIDTWTIKDWKVQNNS